MSFTLVVLAAGMGSRYGGLKQIDPVGPSGETVLDYAVFDAIRAGFARVVFVIRKDFDALFREKIGARYAGRIAVDYVYQSLEALPAGFAPPPGRDKPWGTGHAVWCAREAVRENFAVINADDFYGADSFKQLARFLAAAQGGEFSMVGFRMSNTLSEHGTVSRGVCTSGPNDELQSIVEVTSIAAGDVGAGKKYSGAEIVSMNCWGFTPALFPGLDAQFREFLAARGSEAKSEFYLPAAVSALIARGEARVRVLPTGSTWFGVTYREDKPRVSAAIAALVQAGKYPARLF
ncbi:MAG TPA: sugar phosphate nucleotidyltransferase [Opitutaceae bacterium]|nr:sugar phosphate nucleotidyltransferase [Opitutaceae bacterium]